jgi:hypothetical protein
MPLLMPPSGFRDLGGRSWPATSESEGNELEAEEAMPVPFPVALNVCKLVHPQCRNVCDIFCISEINTTAKGTPPLEVFDLVVDRVCAAIVAERSPFSQPPSTDYSHEIPAHHKLLRRNRWKPQ